EFRLLLKKWSNESIQVAVFSIMRTPSEVLSTAVVQGQIKALTETSFLVADAGDSMARVTFDNCLFRFEDADTLFGVEDATRYQECLVLGLKSDNAHTFVSVMSIKQKTT